jgi:hypothetical protein
MANDFFLDAARRKQASINAEIARVDAELIAARAEDNDLDAGELVSQRASLRDLSRCVGQEISDYIAQHNQRAPELTDAEFMALSPERMMQHPEAVEAIFKKSKYYDPQNDPNDPGFRKRYMDGVQEVARRRAMGQ